MTYTPICLIGHLYTFIHPDGICKERNKSILLFLYMNYTSGNQIVDERKFLLIELS